MAEGFSKLFGTSFDDPRTQGILGLAGGLLEAGGYQSQPMTLGQALSYGGRQGMQSYQTAIEAQRAEADRKLREQQLKQSMEIQAAQEARQAQAVKAKRDAESRLQTGIENLIAPSTRTPMQRTPQQNQLISLAASSPELASLIGQQQVERLTEEKDPFTLSPKQETVTINGQQGTALVQYFPIGSPYIKTLGGDPLTGRVVLSDTFVPAEEKIADVGTIYNVINNATGEVLGQVGDKQANFETIIKDPSTSVVKPAVKTEVKTITDQLSDKSANLIEGQIFNNLTVLDSLDNLRKNYKPEYLRYYDQVSNALSAGLEKSQIGSLFGISEEQAEELYEFTTFTRSSSDVLNAYIKAITGAQMSLQEAIRIQKAIPNPKDSETVFLSKLDDFQKQTQLSNARLVYIRDNNLEITKGKSKDIDGNEVDDAFLGATDVDGKALTFGRMEDVIASISENTIKSLKDDGFSDEDAYKRTEKFIKQRYGVDLYLFN